MKKLLVTLTGIVALLLGAGSAQAAYIETFHANNADWFYGYIISNNPTINSATWISTGGNPDGNISGAANNLFVIWTDSSGTVDRYGDMTGFTMTIDTMVSGGAPTGAAQFYVGREGSYYLSGTWSIGSDTVWTTHTAVLNTFTARSGASLTLAQVLQAPDDIGLYFGASGVSGAGNVLVDNFGTTPTVVPIPAAVWLFGSGLLGLVGIARRKKAA